MISFVGDRIKNTAVDHPRNDRFVSTLLPVLAAPATLPMDSLLMALLRKKIEAGRHTASPMAKLLPPPAPEAISEARWHVSLKKHLP